MEYVVKTFFSQRKSVHNHILDMPDTNKSRAAYLLLYDKLNEQDESAEWKVELKKWLLFRKEFLETQVVDNKLKCVYCDRDDLVPGTHKFKLRNNNNRVPNLATVDHIYPLSLGGPKYDETNCCVACKKCNSKKGNKLI